MPTPNPPSLIWGTTPSAPPTVDPPIRQDATFGNSAGALRLYRAYRDSQILGVETHLVQSLLGGTIATWVHVDSQSAAIQTGQWVCSAGSTAETVTLATSVPLAAAGLPIGLAMTPGVPGGWVRVAVHGKVSARLTGLVVGSLLYAVVNTTTGFTTTKTTLLPSDYLVGTVDAAGTLNLAIQVPGTVGATGAQGNPGVTTWQTALDLDLTAQANQTFATDTTYTYAGMTWVKTRSVADQVAMANVSGSGLVIQPANAAGATFSAGSMPWPVLSLPFSQFLASLDFDWPLRISARVTALTSGADCSALLYAGVEPTSGSASKYFAATKGQTSKFTVNDSGPGSSSAVTYNDATAYAANDTLTIYLPSGLAGLVQGLVSANFALPHSYIGGGMTPNNASATWTALSLANWCVGLGAGRNTTTTSATFSHLKVEYQAR